MALVLDKISHCYGHSAIMAKIKASGHKGQRLDILDNQGILTFRELWSATINSD